MMDNDIGALKEQFKKIKELFIKKQAAQAYSVEGGPEHY
jgi:hypothetical protein